MTSAPSSELRDPERSELGSRVVQGVGWKIVSQVATQSTKTVVVILLARLLGPHDFGLAAMVLVLSGFVVTFADCGLGLALVQRKTIEEVDRSSVFWMSLALGTAFTAAGIALAPAVAGFYHSPAVAPLFAALSLNFVITSLGSTQRSLLLRSMHFRSLELRSMAGLFVGATVGVTLALLGYGAWALIGMQLGAAATSTALLWFLSDWRPSLIFSWRRVRELGSFAGRYVGGTTFQVLSANVDNVLVGRWLGAGALGIYTLGYSVILVTLSRLINPLAQVLAPAFSRLQDDREALAASWLRATRLLAVVTLPLMVTVAITAHDLVAFLFGQHWMGVVPILRILTVVCAIQSLQALADVVLQALGRMRTYIRMTGIAFAMNVAAFVVGLHWGVVGVSAAFALSTFMWSAWYTSVVAAAVGRSLADFVRALSGVLQAVCGLAVAEYAVQWTAVQAGTGTLGRLVLVWGMGIAVFLPLCFWRVPEAMGELRRVRHLIGMTRRPVAAAPSLR